MKIARLIDTAGQIHYGSPSAAGQARRLAGSLYEGLTETSETLTVARWLAPVLPVNIYGIGLNYRAHAIETGAALPESPVLFMKPTTTIANPGDAIALPLACEHGPEVDYEAELAVLIGRTARDVPVAHALDYILGYTCANDVSARRWQKQGGAGQWIRGKSFDGFSPLGPWLVTADEIQNPQDLEVTCTLNGERVQTGNTSDMIFSVAEVIAFLSRDTTLLPGTLILTGTPPGVGMARNPPRYLSDGDQVVVEIAGIGALANPVRQTLPSATS
ncbi:fumarylacetoacetate hydrolase family protein [uncultured Lamprocystis sp.]|jgi:2-keto-4-pentenoate hydratase/2-oxohepta-3-ene-1,7-dioic acid hydratase in catechol pathway|uniref:fumarylacetoacetate hydrolase family protein n=2 Tax=uncultured Lamprocystis sp. TaxID=543132 RepID=UPI0025EA83EF|nr:fumarylacetoacetate hydrolase family protein [uncultured Lamprocystis sp.]